MGLLGGPLKITQQSKSQTCEDLLWTSSCARTSQVQEVVSQDQQLVRGPRYFQEVARDYLRRRRQLCERRTLNQTSGGAAGDGGAVGVSCRTLLCPRWVLFLFVKEFWGRAQQGVTEEALIAVGVAAMLVIIFWRSWGGSKLETGRHLQGYGVSSLRWVDNGKRESS